jgi:hypothetical protein
MYGKLFGGKVSSRGETEGKGSADCQTEMKKRSLELMEKRISSEKRNPYWQRPSISRRKTSVKTSIFL